MNVVVSGPRGQNFWYKDKNGFHTDVRKYAKEFYLKKFDDLNKSEKIENVFTGMALFIDQIVAEVCVELQIPFIASIPYLGQESRWSASVQHDYWNLVKKASRVVYVFPGGHAEWKLLQRNEWMINGGYHTKAQDNFDPTIKVDYLLTCLKQPVIKSGGTYQATEYAIQKKVPVINCWPGLMSYLEEKMQ